MKLSDTRQRRVILRELRAVKSHPNAGELFRRVRTYLPKISLGTVYRNLEILAEAGEILQLESAGREKRFDGNAQPHLHLRCEHCEAVEDVPDADGVYHLLEPYIKGRVRSVHVEFSGLCAKCAAEGEDHINTKEGKQ